MNHAGLIERTKGTKVFEMTVEFLLVGCRSTPQTHYAPSLSDGHAAEDRE